MNFFNTPHTMLPAPAETRGRLMRHSAIAVVAAGVLLAPLAPFAYGQVEPGFDRPQLLAAAEDALHADLEGADRHILVVRHADKVSPDCNAIECALSEMGQAQVAALTALIGEPPVDAAYASAACRATATAEAGGLWVTMHRAGDDYPLACGGGTVDRTRNEAMTEAREGLARWTIVGEHSNTTCLWVAAFAGDDAAARSGCVDGALEHDAYGDVFWLYRLGGEWQAIVLADAFLTEDPAAE